MLKLSEKLITEIEQYKDALDKFMKGEVSPAYFKGIRVPWGFYSQRGEEFLMARLRIPAGIMTPEQLGAVGRCAREFADGTLHITTRQDIQIHYLPYENSVKVLEFLKEYHISTRGGGGNTVRNITACPLSGVCIDERIEVYRYALALTQYFLSLDEAYNLPRKFKIAFSGCEKDCAFAGVNDVGIIAVSGKFKVLCGGGMGAKPAVGRVIENELAPSEIGYTIRAIFNLFNKYGDRRNRYHNRLRFLIQDMGWEKFVILYREELKQVKKDDEGILNINHSLPEVPSVEVSENLSALNSDFLKFNLGTQKQKGYFYIKVRVPRGEMSSEQAESLSEIIKIIPHVIFRTTQRQNLIITNVPGNRVKEVCRKLKEVFGEKFLYPDTIFDILSCKGALTCNLGLCNSMGLAEELERVLFELKESIEGIEDLTLNINGCPNACGQHPIGLVSFSGLTRKVYSRTAPFYRVYMNGGPDSENTSLAKEMGMIPAKSVPPLLVALIKNLNSEEDIRTHLRGYGEELMRALVDEYSYIPSIKEGREYYIDFGRTEEFSLEGLTRGECGAGVIDMIEADISSAEHSIASARKGFSYEDITKAIEYSARALLVLEGIDPKTPDESAESFVNVLVKRGIAHPRFRELKEFYINVREEKVEVNTALSYAEDFLKEVKEIYSLMDPHFNLPIRFASEEPVRKEDVAKEVYDLRGTPCPLNFVKAKLKLEEMEIGDVLEIYLDEGAPIKNVPRSLENEGHTILNIEKKGGYYSLKVRKEV